MNPVARFKVRKRGWFAELVHRLDRYLHRRRFRRE